MFAKISNKSVVVYPYTESMIREDNPTTSFPETIPVDIAVAFGATVVYPSDKPTVDYTKNVTEGTPVFSGDTLTQVWLITPASSSEVSERLENAWMNLRDTRNQLLSESDWTQLDDSPVSKAEWAVYRQALRDLPSNTTDPFNPAWPVKPK